MKKAVTLICILIIISVLLVGCTTKKPPSLDVACNIGDKVWHKEATLGTYGWRWFGGGIQSDSISPMDMEKTGIITTFEIDAPECNITITFKDDCDSFAIYGEPLENGEPLTTNYPAANINTYTFMAKANYVYSVIAQFDQGDAVYAFSVKTK